MANPFRAEDLHKAWMHSHEEDRGDELVYRTADYPFPPARGRDGFELLAGGALRYRGPGADDRRIAIDGTWRIEGDDLIIHVAGRSPERLKIRRVESDRLTLTR